MSTDERITMTMEEGARKLRDSLEEDLARLARIEELRDRAPGRFGLDEAWEEAEMELYEKPYGISVTMQVEVMLYGGGPAGGVIFDCEQNKRGLEMLSARAWHQDWFQPKGYWPLDDDTAERFFELWGIADMPYDEH